MIVRGLWGIEIEPLKKYSFLSDASFRISMASINSFDDPRRTSVFISFQGKEFKLCSLIPEKIEQQVIDITCLEGEEIVFRSEGPNCIHLTGNYVSLYESDSEDEDENTKDVSKERYVKELSQTPSIEYDQNYTDFDDERFDMPIIHEYLDKNIKRTETTTNSFNQLNTIHNIPQNIDISTFAMQKALQNSNQMSDSETSQSEVEEENTQSSESEQDEREIIVIPSEQTSDIESDHEESSAVESNYQSCNEESKEKDEELDTIETGFQSKVEKEIELKDVNQKTELDNNADTPVNKSPTTTNKTSKKLENNESTSSNTTSSTKVTKKEKAKAATLAKNKKNSSKASPNPLNSKAKSTKKSEKNNAKSNPTKSTVSNNIVKKDAATKKNTSTNNNTNMNKSKNENPSKNPSKSVSKKTSFKSNTKNTHTTSNNNEKSKNDTSTQFTVETDDDLVKRYPKRRRAPDDEPNLEVTIEKSISNNSSRQTSVETEDRYPKRKRAPNYEHKLELMAVEDAKMEAAVRSSNQKRKRRTKPSLNSS